MLGGDQLLCHPVFALELLHNAIHPADYRRLREDLDSGLDWVWPDRDTAVIATGMQQRMATGAPTAQRVRTADLLIASLAVQHGIGVVHYDSDYDVIGDLGAESFDSEWLAPRGSLEGANEKPATARRAYSRAFGRRMIQFRDDADLEIWPELIVWMDEQLSARGLDVPPSPQA